MYMKNAERKKILLTGGHLSPLLAVISKLGKKFDCIVAGRKYTFEADHTISLEYMLLKDRNIPFFDIKAARLQRKFTRHTIPSFFKFPLSFWSAYRLIKKEHPNTVLTFGGYIGLPVSIAAYFMGVPVVLHEQTQHAGLTNRMIGKIAKKICISYPTSKKYFQDAKTVLTGNPLRCEIFESRDSISIQKDLPLLFITGGSAGAHRVNEYIESILPRLLSRFSIIHQTGDAQEFKDYDKLSNFKNNLPLQTQKRYVVKKFIMPDEIGWVYKNADMIIARAGANTVSELIVLSKKALLIPLPFSQNQEQKENAMYFKSLGLGDFIEEKNINPGTLYQEIRKVYEQKLPQVKKEQSLKDAAETIANIVIETSFHENK